MIFKDGFSFCFDESSCKECGGKCCTGESGFIFINEFEILAISRRLNIAREDFLNQYTKRVGSKISLIEKPHPTGLACIFFENGGCDIYEDRPANCRSFPFWDIFRDNPMAAFRECEGVKAIQNKRIKKTSQNNNKNDKKENKQNDLIEVNNTSGPHLE